MMSNGPKAFARSMKSSASTSPRLTLAGCRMAITADGNGSISACHIQLHSGRPISGAPMPEKQVAALSTANTQRAFFVGHANSVSNQCTSLGVWREKR